MESKCLPDKPVDVPPVPIKTYQWEDLRRAREVGAYPWTHIYKPLLEGEITAEDILRETTPRRSMSRDVSKERSRTRSPIDNGVQRILNLDSSPGSSRKHGEEGEENGINIPNFSKEISLDSEEDLIDEAVNRYLEKEPEEEQDVSLKKLLTFPNKVPINISPKGILKRRLPVEINKSSETREKSKCCHPLVNKIKHIADKTLHKHDKSDNNRSPIFKRKKTKGEQEIVQLKTSPGAVRRQKFGAIKLGDSDEMSKTLNVDLTPLSSRKKKEHIYEDIEHTKSKLHDSADKCLQFSPEVLEALSRPMESSNALEHGDVNKESENQTERKSNASQDPSLCIEEDTQELRPEDHIMESLHMHVEVNKEALVLEMDTEEPDIDEVFLQLLQESPELNRSPNITITEITDEDADDNNPNPEELSKQDYGMTQELSDEGNSTDAKTIENPDTVNDWSKSNSDHEYEIIGKPPPSIVSMTPIQSSPKADDEVSSTTSLERKYLQHMSDEEEQTVEKEISDDVNDKELSSAEALQKDIEDRYFVSTPSTVSRTECEISTSQVDSSALENLPLKRDSRQKNSDGSDSKLQQRIKEQTGKLRNQAGKLKTKLQSIKQKQFSLPDKPKFNFSERPKFQMPERPKINFPDRPKFSLPDRRKFSLPDRPKFKKINISEKLSLGDRKKFTLPERPRFTMPDLPKFRLPDKPKINFGSLGRKKEYRIEPDSTESSTDIKNVATVEFESRTFPRLFNRKKKPEVLATSSPTLNRDDTPPPTFSFAKVKKDRGADKTYKAESIDEPREYGSVLRSTSLDEGENGDSNNHHHFEAAYDFETLQRDYDEDNRRFHEAIQSKLKNDDSRSSLPDVSSSKPECTHVINEINNDEFFVRPKGISRENIQVRQYLSDEIREAFKMPTNSLAMMGSDTDINDMTADIHENEGDPELYLEDEQERHQTGDLIDKDDGYYTFPPVRPSRAKRMKKDIEHVDYIDQSANVSMQFSDVELEVNDESALPENFPSDDNMCEDEIDNHISDEVHIQFVNSQTLPTPPKRKKKPVKSDIRHISLNDLQIRQPANTTNWQEQERDMDDIIVYRTEHAYIVPRSSAVIPENSPIPPRRSRNRSRSSHGTSFGDDDRTSHGAESLALDPHLPITEPGFEFYRDTRHESPGYATVDKYSPSKAARRSNSKTPPVRRRKSHSSERKYYTVDRVVKGSPLPSRPPRKKSSTSLITLDSFRRDASSGDVTQYVEIDEHEEIHRDLHSGEIINKMKDRPLPPPPRPPRGPKRKKSAFDNLDDTNDSQNKDNDFHTTRANPCQDHELEEVVEIEVSTQTDPLPDDLDYELGMDENIDISMSSSLRDIVDDDALRARSPNKLNESPRNSRPTSRSEKSFLGTDQKFSEFSKQNLGRSSPTVILVERRVSSPTRINERDVIVTEASLTVQHIDVDESIIPDVPPLPVASNKRARQASKPISNSTDDKALEKVEETSSDVQLDNLITQRLQVRDLDVGRLNVSELQASKILVSEIEGMTLQVTELDSKSGHISVSGIELSPSVVDEIVKKFAELATTNTVPSSSTVITEPPRPMSREEETQTDIQSYPQTETPLPDKSETQMASPTSIVPDPVAPPQRPPPPDLSPLLYSYLQDLSIPPATFYNLRPPRERPFTEFYESQHQAPPPPTRRAKRKPKVHTESSSDDECQRPSPRRMPPPVKVVEPSVSEAGAQFIR